jgi:predicted GNAT family N-acyltransferase
MFNGAMIINTEYGTNNAVFTDAYSIRVSVFVGEQLIPIENERDEYDDTAYHCVVYIYGIPVGCGRLSILGTGTAKICRVATLSEYRHKGYASVVCKSLIELAQEKSATEIFLNAQVSAMRLYERLGFVAIGEFFYEENIPHIKMIYLLSSWEGCGR